MLTLFKWETDRSPSEFDNRLATRRPQILWICINISKLQIVPAVSDMHTRSKKIEGFKSNSLVQCWYTLKPARGTEIWNMQVKHFKSIFAEGHYCFIINRLPIVDELKCNAKNNIKDMFAVTIFPEYFLEFKLTHLHPTLSFMEKNAVRCAYLPGSATSRNSYHSNLSNAKKRFNTELVVNKIWETIVHVSSNTHHCLKNIDNNWH